MPEGDSVYRVAVRLRRVLLDQALTRTEFRVPAFADVTLVGQVVDGVSSRGKHLLIDAGYHTIWSHLSMEGHWRIYRPGDRWTSPAHTARCILATEGCEVVGFSLGFLRVLPTGEVARKLAYLGPDPLGQWDPDTAVANLRAQGARPIGLALLDQSVIAGIGNVYRSEVLFLVGIHPQTPTDRVPEQVLTELVGLSARLLRLNKDRTRRTTTGNAGGPASWVYGRRHQPCLRCRTPIRHGLLGDPRLLRGSVGGPGMEPVERSFYWCPSCQPGDAHSS